MCSVHRGMFSISEDTMSTSGDIMMHVGEQGDKAFQFILKTPNSTHDIPLHAS